MFLQKLSRYDRIAIRGSIQAFVVITAIIAVSVFFQSIRQVDVIPVNLLQAVTLGGLVGGLLTLPIAALLFYWHLLHPYHHHQVSALHVNRKRIRTTLAQSDIHAGFFVLPSHTASTLFGVSEFDVFLVKICQRFNK